MKKGVWFLSFLVVLGMMFATTAVIAAPPPAKPTPNSHAQNPPQANPNAPGEKHGPVQHYKGTVTAVSSTSLTLTLKDGSTVNVGIDANTKIHIPTLQAATWDQINLNVQVVVQARAGTTGEPVARRILVVPGKPLHFHRVGTVTAYNPGVDITIQDKDGQTTKFLLAPQAKILPPELAGKLAVGAKVTIISRRDPTGGPLTAQGVVVHPAGDTQESTGTD